ncbi:shufflon system plasmid conjugative transfer pilus tip adhesin PilV [Burkholderia ambifaria]|uniref:shufflon system plasmid conjugative transfer pilus tip adhesin PilV n=1 Tax=Burkholderia ambifaria TaxID=152480 RepID=UPI002FE0D4F4
MSRKILLQLGRPSASIEARRQREGGVGALEMIAVIGIFISMIALSAPFVTQWSNSRTDQIVADQFKLAMQGANTFIQNNSATIVAAANPTVVYSWAQMAGSMPAGLSPTNTFGQTYQLAIQKTGTAPNYTLNPMLQTTGGQPIPENELRAISASVGGSGGYISTLTPTVATGAKGSWGPLTLTSFGANPGAGRLAGALFYQTSTQANQYLYRVNVPGHPELNQMQTSVDMQSNNVNNAGIVNTNKLATNGLNANDMPPTWGGGIRTWDVYAGGTVGVGPGGGAPPVAWMAQNGIVQGQTLNSTGDVNAQGTVTGQNNVNAGANVNAGGQIWAGGNISTNGNITLNSWGSAITNPGRMHINTGENLYLQPWSGGSTIVGGGGGSGNLIVTGNLDGNGYIKPGQIAWAGAGCGPNGALGTDGQQALFCNSGVWTAAGGGGSAVSHCKGSSCTITLPSAGTWDIFGVAYVHQYAWLGGWFYINGALVDTNANEGDQDGTGWGIMSGSYRIAVGGPTTIGANTVWNGTWGDFTINLHATKE